MDAAAWGAASPRCPRREDFPGVTDEFSAAAAEADWFALDFETADFPRASACALGLAAVKDGRLSASTQWLIQPPDNYFDPWISQIHGITPDLTAGAPSFGDLWPSIHEILAGRVVLMHNAGFDVGVIRAEHALRGMPSREMAYACTLVLSRRVLGDLDSYRLPLVCERLGIDFSDHHDARADAAATASVALGLLGCAGTDDPIALCEDVKVRLGLWGPDDVRCRGIGGGGSITAAPHDDADPDHPLFGVRLVFTGTLAGWRRRDAADAAAACGARVSSAVSRKTDYLVVGIRDRGVGPLSAKQVAAHELIDSGAGIKVMDEYEFTRLVDDWQVGE